MLKFLIRTAYFFLRQRRLRWPRWPRGPFGPSTPCYTVIPDFKSRAWCERAISELPFDSSAATETGEDVRIFGAEKLSACARELATDTALLTRASAQAGAQGGTGGGAQAGNAEALLFCMANKLTHKGGFGSGGEWHRDGFRHELKALLYLTDVTEDDGPFAIVEGSHTTWRIVKDTLRMAMWGMRDPTRLKDAGTRFGYKALTGTAGTLILFDASAIHTGLPIKAGRTRFAITNYYAQAGAVEVTLAYYRGKVVLN